LLQPLVENAVKHGIAQKQAGGEVSIRARVERVQNDRRQLLLVVRDTGAGTTTALLQRGRETGVGLRNVERRLECQYGPDAVLTIDTASGLGTTVELRMPVEFRVSELQDARRGAM
jgi:two-component system LytT family sensor kinase